MVGGACAASGHISIYVYHGANRVRDPAFLAKHDVVITTYSTLAAELPSEKKGKASSPEAIAGTHIHHSPRTLSIECSKLIIILGCASGGQSQTATAEG